MQKHVQEQFEKYGPLSKDREHFGVIYEKDGVIHSRVVEGRVCNGGKCSVDVIPAFKDVTGMDGAKILGEWHTHPTDGGSWSLTVDDVSGANGLSGAIDDYRAFFSNPDSYIYEWDPTSTTVSGAMDSKVKIGKWKH